MGGSYDTIYGRINTHFSNKLILGLLYSLKIIEDPKELVCEPYLFLAYAHVYAYVCVCAKSFQSCLTLCDPMNCRVPPYHQASLSTECSRKEYWSGLPWPSPRDLPNSGIEPTSFMSPAFAGRIFTTCATWEAHLCLYLYLYLFLYVYLYYISISSHIEN